MSDIPILLLAAGASNRMRGRDKLMEEVGGLEECVVEASLYAWALDRTPAVTSAPGRAGGTIF